MSEIIDFYPKFLLVDRNLCNLRYLAVLPILMNDYDNDNEIDLFRHHNGNNTNIKVIFKQVTMLDRCKCI